MVDIEIKNSGTEKSPYYQIMIDGKEYCATESLDNAEEIVKLCSIPHVNGSFRALAFTDKMKEARDFVIKFTKEHDHPPSYQILANALRIKRTAAYNRMKYCRELMACRQ